MTNSGPDPEEAAGTYSFTDEEIAEAQSEEQAAMSQATINHLNQRVVILRALANRLLKERAEAVEASKEGGPHLTSVGDD